MIIVNQLRNKTYEFRELVLEDKAIKVIKDNKREVVGTYATIEEAKKAFLNVLDDADRKKAISYLP